MVFLIQNLSAKLFGFVLFLFQESKFEVHTIWKEITPFGWILIIGLPLVFILGIIFLIVKILKKPKLK